MTRPMKGGRRRIDRVLDESFIAEIADMPIDEVRRRRFEAEQEEADLSYLRRLLHGRIDIVTAEIARREGGGKHTLVEDLVGILTDPVRSARGLGRHLSVQPTRVAEHRRLVERLIADPTISDVTHQSDEELSKALEMLKDNEREVSEVRHQVQEVVDLLTGELTGRYRDGRASVDSLLRQE